MSQRIQTEFSKRPSSSSSTTTKTSVQSSREPAYSSSSFSLSSFDVVILDHKMPKKNGLEVAKEILEINPEQWIIFASAYVKETLEKSVEELKAGVELLQKPFSMHALIDTVENREVYEGLKIVINTSKDIIKELENPSTEQIKELFEALRRTQKFRTNSSP